MSPPSDRLCRPGTGVFMPHTCTLQPSDSSKPQAPTDASHTNNSRTAASIAARRSGPYTSSIRSWSFPYAGVSSCQGGDMGLPAGSWMASGAQAGNAHSLPPQYRAAGSAGCSSRVPALARASAASAAHGAGAASSAAMNSMNALLTPVSEEVYAAAAAAQRGRLAVEAIDEELLMLLQAKGQLEAGRTALYGYSAACSAAPASLSAPLPGSPPQQWEAPHDANGHLAAAQYHHDSQGEPCLQDIMLQTYMELHQQQLAGHRLCMQTVSESCMLGGSLDAAAHAKLRRLMELQRMQLQLQEKLLHSLASYNGNM
ncbi:hypothetical protein OEZ85_008753 [Tetradesmus obliquus]|uniref:MYB-CC type transcription factor LHEQLE-containing domain-containing protein n=1 Tax=Tetradesmus obliquus TaxID=3088 RepID=A0ABY8TNG6_TETOB|nr:hypothetical protein OEZ85_008753 [Tetradesmus obliquus]